MAPLGYLPHLGPQTIAHVNIEAQGRGETAVSLDVRLKVHDPSGVAGVNIDLIRIAATALRSGAWRLSGGDNLASEVTARDGDLKTPTDNAVRELLTRWAGRVAARTARAGRW